LNISRGTWISIWFDCALQRELMPLVHHVHVRVVHHVHACKRSSWDSFHMTTNKAQTSALAYGAGEQQAKQATQARLKHAATINFSKCLDASTDH
jgi:hypothetical protein